MIAFGAIKALNEAGFRIPEDIALVGYDDIPLAAFAMPALTTMRSDPTGHGQDAMELLLAQLHHEAGTVPSHAEREPELVIRVVRKSGTRIKPEARKHPHHRRIDRPLALAVDCRNFAKADFRSTTDIIRGKPQRLADALHVVDDLFRPVMRTTPSGGHSAA